MKEIAEIRETDNKTKIDVFLTNDEFKAMIHEILRMSCLAPLAIPHACLKKDYKCTFDDENGQMQTVVIPKGCTVYPNLTYTQEHQNINNKWEVGTGKDKYRIKLENFLTHDGTFQRNKHFSVFGRGPRTCVGEKLAIQTISIVVGMLITQFKFSQASTAYGATKIDKIWGLTYHAAPTSFLVQPR